MKENVEKSCLHARVNQHASPWKPAVRTIPSSVWKYHHTLDPSWVGLNLLSSMPPSTILPISCAGNTPYIRIFDYKMSAAYDYPFIMAGSMVTPSLRATWMETEEAIASPLFCTGPALFLWRSPLITAPPSVELEPGSQVWHPQNPCPKLPSWSAANASFISVHRVTAVHTGKLDSKFKAAMVNSTQWQYYGTPNVGGTLNMTWNPSLVRADKVNIELWGYRETGESYADPAKICWSTDSNQSNLFFMKPFKTARAGPTGG